MAFSIMKEAFTESVLNISRTVFVCIVLAVATMLFQGDAERLVLTPIERMLEKVKLISKNPLAAASEEVEKAGIYSRMNQEAQSKGKGKDTTEN